MGQLKGSMDFLLIRHWVRFCSPEWGQSIENPRFHLTQLTVWFSAAAEATQLLEESPCLP